MFVFKALLGDGLMMPWVYCHTIVIDALIGHLLRANSRKVTAGRCGSMNSSTHFFVWIESTKPRATHADGPTDELNAPI